MIKLLLSKNLLRTVDLLRKINDDKTLLSIMSFEITGKSFSKLDVSKVIAMMIIQIKFL